MQYPVSGGLVEKCLRSKEKESHEKWFAVDYNELVSLVDGCICFILVDSTVFRLALKSQLGPTAFRLFV